MKTTQMTTHSSAAGPTTNDPPAPGDGRAGPGATRAKAIWSAPKFLSGAIHALEKKIASAHNRIQKGVQDARAKIIDTTRTVKANVRESAAQINDKITAITDPYHDVKQRLNSDFDLFE